MKKIASILFGLFFVFFVYAQEEHYHYYEHESEHEHEHEEVEEVEAAGSGDQTPKRLYSNDKVQYIQRTNSWIASGILGTVKPVDLDTLITDFIITNPAEKNTIALEFLGNLGSPGRSKIFFDRQRKSGFLFFEPYEIYYTPSKEVRYFDTKLPYTNLGYFSGGPTGKSASRIHGVFAVNINPAVNVGMYGDWINAYGAYTSQSTKHYNTGFFGSYMGKHHNLMANISFNGYENFENGGLVNDSTVTNPREHGNLDAPDMAVFFPRNNVRSKLWNWNTYLNYKYHIGIERDVEITKDSTAKTFIPVTSFIYTFQSENSRKRYHEKDLGSVANFYQTYKIGDPLFADTLFVNRSQTMDSVRFFQMKHVAGISLNQEFNTLMNFGLTGYMVADIKNYSYLNGKNPKKPTEADSLLGFLIHTDKLAKETVYKIGVGATLAKYLGENLTYSFTGEYYFRDEKKKASSFLLEGNVQSKFNIGRQPVSLGAQAEYKREAPDFFEEYYFSNHIQWENRFDHKNILSAKGSLSFPSFAFYPSLGIAFSAGIKDVKNYVYWDKTALPEQHKENIEIVEFSLKEQVKFLWYLHWDNEIVYQKSTNERVIPLPELCWYSNLYFQFDKLFKVLTIQIGANMRYNTEYYAPRYLPATGVFYQQNDYKVGDYPYINAYINCQLKTARFFVQYNHLNRTMSSNNYLVLPGYALDPSYLKIGISIYLKN